MNKICFHIGFPKTGSTSLQESIYSHLNELDFLNYLGKNVGTANSIDSFERSIRELWLNSKPFPISKDNLSEVNLNLFSDEEILSPPSYLKHKYGEKSDSSKAAERLKEFCDSNNVQGKIIIVLRKQESLIYSWYAQYYRYFQNSTAENTINKHVFHQDGTIKDWLKYYKFDEVVMNYIRLFGSENCKVLLFESFVNEKENFYSELFDFLGISIEDINSIVTKTDHLNKKNKNKSNYQVEIRENNGFLQKISRIVPFRLKQAILKHHFISSSKEFILNAILKLRKKKIVEIEGFTENQKQLVFDFFKESNSNLYKLNIIDKTKLEKYKYI